MDNERQQENNECTRHFYVWRCEQVRPEMRPNGAKQKAGCGLWQVKASKYDLNNPYLKATCSCGRHSKLNPKSRKVDDWATRDQANQSCAVLNRETGMLI